MIPEQVVEVILVPKVMQYYRTLGYKVAYKEILKVPVSHLPKNSNKRVQALCDVCMSKFNRQLQLLNKQDLHLCYACAKKEVGKGNIGNTFNPGKYGKDHPNWNPNKTELQAYGRRVHWLTKKTYDKYHLIINPRGLKRARCGVENGYQLDHIISIKEGFTRGIPAEELAKLENLQMLHWKDNRAKWHR